MAIAGIVATDVSGGGRDNAYALAVQDDGKLVVAGASGDDFLLLRYTETGALDTSFGSAGIVQTDSGSDDKAYAVALQADGGIVVVGEHGNYFGVAYHNNDGSLNTGWGHNGLANTLAESITSNGSNPSMALQADGKIVIAGTNNNRFAVLRYNAAPKCFAEITGDDVTDFSSTDASAVQDALDALAPISDTVKLAGTCAGVQMRGGITQTVYISRNVTLQGGYTTTNWLADPDSDSYPTTVDAEGNGRVAVIMGSQVTLDGVQIVNGYANDGSLLNEGGGIWVNGHLTLTHAIVQDNAAVRNGGGIYKGNGSDLTILDSWFEGNAALGIPIATGYGGAIYNGQSGSFFIDNTTFYSNTGEAGGAIINYGPATIINSTFYNNYAGNNGGAINNHDPLTLTNSTLSGNEAFWIGGAIDHGQGSISNLHHPLNHCQQHGQRGGRGIL